MKRNDERGAMPFAVIAVAILLGSMMCMAVATQYGNASENTGNAEKDADAIDIALTNARNHVNRGLGEIIRDISLGGGTGGLSEKTAAFDDRVSDWMSFQFPLEDDGTIMELMSHDIELGTENLSISTLPGATDGHVPVYLRATGTVTVKATTVTGVAEYDMEIRSDGSCSLPLTDSRGSLFESLVSGEGTAMSQMVTYQLASLAQLRVVNGYGALSVHGGRSTSGIITQQDVSDAYENALEVMGLICFRDGDGELSSRDRVDLGDLMSTDSDGKVVIDVSAVYAQALESLLDDIATRWFDYFYGNVIVDYLEDVLEPFKDAINALKSLFTGESVYSAVPLLKTMMELNGYAEEDYRHPVGGFVTFGVKTWNASEQKYVYSYISAEFPQIDIFELDWIKNFKKTYDDGDYIKDYIMEIVRSAGLKLGDRLGLGTVAYEVDPYDSERLVDTLRDAVGSLMDGGGEVISDALYESLAEATIVDPIYMELLKAMEENRDTFTDYATLDANVSAAFLEKYPPATANRLASNAMKSAHTHYDLKLDRYVKMFTDLSELPESGGSFIREALSEILAFILDQTLIVGIIEQRMETMCNEMLDLSMMNSHGVVETLPGMDVFEMSDSDGNRIIERLDVEIISNPVISEPVIVGDQCVHQTGFTDDRTAAYSTVFETSIGDRVEYTVTGMGALAGAMGVQSSTSEGTIDIDMTLTIPVVSGWALKDVEYRPSDTILTDAWKVMLDVLEPVLEPLKKVMEVFKKATSELYEHMADVANFVSGIVETLLGTVGGAIQEIWDWIVESADAFAAEYLENFLIAIGLERQSVSMPFFGYTLTVSTDALSWTDNTKELMTAQLSGDTGDLEFTAGLKIRIRGETEADNVIVTGFGSIKDVKGDWSVKGTLDPLMKGGKHLLTLDGRMGDTDVSLIMPELVQYHELGLTLSDVPGLGDILSNIPLPVAGMEMGVDAGFQLRYSSPVKNGLMINEFESNPKGDDKGNEWVELYNNTTSTIDLDGYTITASSDWREKVMGLSGSIGPGQMVVLKPEFVLVNDSGKYTKSGEALTLKDPDGNKVDKTPTLKDTEDDHRTWHRNFDGCTEWSFSEGTYGQCNGSMLDAVISASDMKDVAWDAVTEAFDRVEVITDMDSLGDFLECVVRNTVDGVIETVTGRLVEAAVFIEVDFSDTLDTASAGLRLALRTESQLPEDILKYIVGEIEGMMFNVENPSGITLPESFNDEVDLELTMGTSIGFPEFLNGGDIMPDLELGITFYTNLSSIKEVAGRDVGRPEVTFGARILDCMPETVPGRLNFDEDMKGDLWVLKVTVGWR